MEEKNKMPLWVALAFANIETRKTGLILFWASLAFTVFCFPLSYYLDDWSWAAMMPPMPIWYWYCIKWMDKNMAWRDQSQGAPL